MRVRILYVMCVRELVKSHYWNFLPYFLFLLTVTTSLLQRITLESFARAVFVFGHQFASPSTSQRFEERIRDTFLLGAGGNSGLMPSPYVFP